APHDATPCDGASADGSAAHPAPPAAASAHRAAVPDHPTCAAAESAQPVSADPPDGLWDEGLVPEPWEPGPWDEPWPGPDGLPDDPDAELLAGLPDDDVAAPWTGEGEQS